jgi:hypothetical protein
VEIQFFLFLTSALHGDEWSTPNTYKQETGYVLEPVCTTWGREKSFAPASNQINGYATHIKINPLA